MRSVDALHSAQEVNCVQAVLAVHCMHAVHCAQAVHCVQAVDAVHCVHSVHCVQVMHCVKWCIKCTVHGQCTACKPFLV